LPIPLESELESFYQTLLDATDTFNTTARVLDKQKLQPAVTDLTAFFENDIVPLANGKNYSISVQADVPLFVQIDREAWKDAMRNLINNAEKHGFLEEKKDYKIIFALSETSENQVKITYQNNGKPFPKGFTFQDFKLLTGKADKKSKSKGAGIGGFWINKVIDLHKGSWAMIEKMPEADFPIQFDIFLPKYERSTH
jgi:nitrogen fixation/metabolism regulation signal transduction histidine kinase